MKYFKERKGWSSSYDFVKGGITLDGYILWKANVKGNIYSDAMIYVPDEGWLSTTNEARIYDKLDRDLFEEITKEEATKLILFGEVGIDEDDDEIL